VCCVLTPTAKPLKGRNMSPLLGLCTIPPEA
jgi:hypothetical protein